METANFSELVFLFINALKKKKASHCKLHNALIGYFLLNLKKILFIYLFLAVLVLRSCAVLSLDLTSGGSSLAVMCRLLIAVASLVGEHRLNSYGTRT